MNTKTYNFLTISYFLIIILGSSIPSTSIPKSYIFKSDKLLHLLEYFILGYLLINILKYKTNYPMYLSFILGLFFAMIDEIYQSTVSGRFSSSFDVIADAMGLTLSIIFNKKISKIIDR